MRLQVCSCSDRHSSLLILSFRKACALYIHFLFFTFDYFSLRGCKTGKNKNEHHTCVVKICYMCHSRDFAASGKRAFIFSVTSLKGIKGNLYCMSTVSRIPNRKKVHLVHLLTSVQYNRKQSTTVPSCLCSSKGIGILGDAFLSGPKQNRFLAMFMHLLP